MARLKEIAATVASVASPGMTPMQLKAAVLKKHPKASGKEIA